MYERKIWKVWMHNLEGFDSHLIAAGYDGTIGEEEIDLEVLINDYDDDDECEEITSKERVNRLNGHEEILDEQTHEWKLSAVPMNNQKIKMLKIGKAKSMRIA